MSNSLSYVTKGNQQHPVLVFLHGFTGSKKTWAPIMEHLSTHFYCLAIDLIGHGESISPRDITEYSTEKQVKQVMQVIDQVIGRHPFSLIGYSMGGRLALQFALVNQSRMTALILESASPGLEEQSERHIRKQADDELAQMIEEQGVYYFVDYWENIPLFRSQQQLSEAMRASIRQERLAQHPVGLANSLRGFGTGVMPSLWSKLSEIQLPTLLITGSLDKKFVRIANQMTEQLSQVTTVSVENVGHAIHVENHTEFATIVEKFFLNLKEEK